MAGGKAENRLVLVGGSSAGSRLQSFGAAGEPAPIGGTLQSLRQDLLSCAEQLGSFFDPAGANLVHEAHRLLKRQVCRVAVVGQIKAGKSSFVNAFVQQPALLPTDVNPLTTSVTHLHLSQQPPGPATAIFRFFTAQEWEELARGGGKLRELTERLVPGFEPELLSQHVANVRRLAAQRLGPDFEQMLGGQHEFEAISPEVLSRYVCSVEHTKYSAQAPAIGQFSDITKSADIYLPKGPFAFPATVIDTPGTNDPFLMRDEITRRCLEAADLYVVVLTARQPLSTADVALLRILRGLRKDRIVVFINRIDELTDIGKDSGQVVQYVRERLALEFPGADIPIIAGSARWALAAEQIEQHPFDRVIERRSCQYFQERQLIAGEELTREGLPVAIWKPRIHRALTVASGLPKVAEAIDGLLASSHAAYVIRQVASCFAEMARASGGAARNELAAKEANHFATVSTAQRTQDALAEIDSEVARLQEASSAIELTARDIGEHVASLVERRLDSLSLGLQTELDIFIEHECAVLLETLESGNNPRSWTCDTLAIRRRLGEVYALDCRRTEAQLFDIQQRVSAELVRLLSLMVPGSLPPAEPQWGMTRMTPPSSTSLSRVLALDLDSPWWAQWWSRRLTPEQHRERLATLIQSEFEPVLAELRQSVERMLNSHVEMTTSWSFAFCNVIVQSLIAHQEKLRSYHTSLQNSVVGTADPQTVSELERHLGALKQRVADYDGLGRKLAVITTSINEMIAAQGEAAP